MKPLFGEKTRNVFRKLFTINDEQLFQIHKKVNKTENTKGMYQVYNFLKSKINGLATDFSLRILVTSTGQLI